MICVSTPRFGKVQRDSSEIVRFPSGIIGFELQREWLVLGDREHGALYWLQNVENVELSLAVVDPREFVSDYRLHVQRGNLGTIWNASEQLVVLSVVTEYEQQLCLNLRHPLVINPARRIGCQVTCNDERAIQHALPEQTVPLRQSA